MKCADVRGLISEYLDDELQETPRLDFASHLKDCADCTAEVESTRVMLRSLRELSGERCPVDCWIHVEAGINPDVPRFASFWRWILRPVVAAPALAVTAALAVILAWPPSTVPMASDKAFAPEYTYYIGAHSHLQRQQAFADPDVVFVQSELQKASLVSDGE